MKENYESELKKAATSLLLKERKLDKLQEKYDVSDDKLNVDLDRLKGQLSVDILGY